MNEDVFETFIRHCGMLNQTAKVLGTSREHVGAMRRGIININIKYALLIARYMREKADTVIDPSTSYGEHEVRSRGSRDRRALTGEAGNGSRRQVMVEASAWRRPDESGPNLSRVMRTNFGDTMAKIFCEHSDSHYLIYILTTKSGFFQV